MTTTSCPNCGKPLRPGVRFCGSCGHTITDTPLAQAGAQPAGPATIACPQCGKPVRVGAKFCSNCGKVLQKEPAPAAVPVDRPVSVPPAKQAVQPQSGPVTVTKPPAGSTPARVVAPPQSKTGSGRKILWPLIIFVMLVVCGLGSGGAYVYLKDPFGWLSSTKASQTAPVPSQTSELVVTATATPVGLSTQNPPTPTFTMAVVPTVTATLTATLEVSPTIPLTPSMPISGTTPLGAPVILLQDDFNDPLNIKWKAWGNPRPVIRSGPGDNWMELTATEKPETAGVTARASIANSPGNVIEFVGLVNPNYTNFPLFFDWDPLQFDRGPENTSLTVLHLKIQSTRIVFQAPAANNTCQKEFDGAKQHTITIKFIGEKKVELYIDGNEQAICQLDMGIKAVSGRISFTGTGWVTRILVTGSSLP
jgi:hypothetical protein